MENIGNARKYLKAKLQRDCTTLHGFDNQRDQVKDLFERTAKEGESNSALLIGPKRGGKTTLVNSVLNELLHDNVFTSNTILISLNGLIQTNDQAALKSTTTQMNLDKAVEGKVFGSFSENLSFLLSCLKTGKDNNSQRLIFVIEEFDLFCAHHNQTLLYNLFDVAQSAQTTICVLGITDRLDVVELLEKRVKSRFTHRQILLFPESHELDAYLELFVELLELPSASDIAKFKQDNPPLPKTVLEDFRLPFLRRRFDPSSIPFRKDFVSQWNQNIRNLTSNRKVVKSLMDFYEVDESIASLKLFLFQIVAKLDENHPNITVEDVTKLAISLTEDDDKVKLMIGLSVLEVCLLIAIKHHCEIYDNNPFNFEIIFTRFSKFAIMSTTMQKIEREIVLKRFENLKHLDFIVPFGAVGKVQKEYQLHIMHLLPGQIDKAIRKYQNLPIEVEQWCKSSII